jgi:hypothetical protein
MTFGREGEEQVRTSNLDECASILDRFQSYGHTEVDTSRFYGVRIPVQSLFPNLDINSTRMGHQKNTSRNWIGRREA